MRFIGIKGWFPPDLGEQSPGVWAPDACYRTTNDYEKIVTYKPIKGKELEIEPPENCRTVDDYKKYKELGFTSVMTSIDGADVENAFKAGWKPEEITLWLHSTDKMNEKPGIDPLTWLDLRIKYLNDLYRRVRDTEFGQPIPDTVNFPFRALYVDEPHESAIDDTILENLYRYLKEKRKEQNNLYYTDDYVTLLEIGEFRTPFENHTTQYAGYGDYIYYDSYDSDLTIGEIIGMILFDQAQLIEDLLFDSRDNQIPEWYRETQQPELRNKLQGAFMSLYKDHGEYGDLFEAADRFQWTHMKLYAQSKGSGESWDSCEEFYDYLRAFISQAVLTGWLVASETINVLPTMKRQYCKHYNPHSEHPCENCDPENMDDWQDTPPEGLPRAPRGGSGIVRIQKSLGGNEAWVRGIRDDFFHR